MVLTLATDYLWFEKVDCSQQSLTATMTRGAAVLTPNLIAMIPVQSMGSVFVATVLTRYGGSRTRCARCTPPPAPAGCSR